MYPQSMFSAKKKTYTFFHLKIIFFTALKNCSKLHGRVIVMDPDEDKQNTGDI